MVNGNTFCCLARFAVHRSLFTTYYSLPFMFLLEHDAKHILARGGIPVPPGCLVAAASDLDRVTLPRGPWMIKGQIGAGGRG